MPHCEISSLFNFDIISGVKSYKPANVSKPTGTSSVRVDHDSLKKDMTLKENTGKVLNLGQFN